MENRGRLGSKGQKRSANVSVREFGRAHVCMSMRIAGRASVESQSSETRTADKVNFHPSAGRHAAEAGEEEDAQTSGREGMCEMGKAERQITAKLRTHKTMLITAGADSFIFMRWRSGVGAGMLVLRTEALMT